MREYKGLSTLPLISIEKDLVEKEIGKTLTDKQWAIVREEILYQTWSVQQKMKDLITKGEFDEFLKHYEKLYQRKD
jgi:hypothetical protein|tara:strand:+ start:102 stop:329 length:228 start_codon:yes stop_codon:yes gene_type:complete